jgi:glucan phosphoethanolaminetransferase (alkaline phosphatase superfamily)
MSTGGAVASLALPLIVLPALVGGIMRWWLKRRLRPTLQVAIAAAALYVILLIGTGIWLSATELAEGEGFIGLQFLLLFLAILGIPIAVAVALWVRSSILHNVKTGA